ncbi:MAG: hypothetical protein JWQ30_1554 [Sediminibacterium sp.]|nr:hypothetical protein [Sediminibacterium sp.]
MFYSRIRSQSNKSHFGPDFLNLDMKALQIEILDPKALQLIKEMEDQNLIKVNDQPSTLKSYLKKMRANSATAPSLGEITKIVKKVRAERYAKK